MGLVGMIKRWAFGDGGMAMEVGWILPVLS